jgi:hypothetical protein
MSCTPDAPPERTPDFGGTAARAESPLGVVTMSVHKLTAGSGYDYLTRQVAALDATEKGHTGLASYYTERGESPVVWVGSGVDGGTTAQVDQSATSTSGQRSLSRARAHGIASVGRAWNRERRALS